MASQEGHSLPSCVAVIATIVFGIALFEDAIWANKLYYWTQITVKEIQQIGIASSLTKLHDCEFMNGTMGEKKLSSGKVITRCCGHRETATVPHSIV